MSRFEKIAAKLPEYGIDAVLVTGAANRLYATGFPSSAGAALVTGKVHQKDPGRDCQGEGPEKGGL